MNTKTGTVLALATLMLLVAIFLGTAFFAPVLAHRKALRLDKQIYTAIQAGDLAAVKALVHEGYSLSPWNSQDGLRDWTPLFLAATSKNSSSDMVEFLVENGLSPNLRRKDGEIGFSPALYDAASMGRADLVAALIKKGANVNFPARDETNRESMPLDIAAFQGHQEVVRLLISARANLHGSSGVDDLGPLAEAARQGHVEIVRLLIDAGASVPDPVSIQIVDNKAEFQTIQSAICSAPISAYRLSAYRCR